MNINKLFNDYVKKNFCGLSAHTLTQVLTDYMINGWDTSVCINDSDDYWRQVAIRPYINNKHFRSTAWVTPYTPSVIANIIVYEELYNEFIKHNNYELFEIVCDIVHNCPYV